MLVLSRKPGEKVIIGGGITVTVLEVIGNRVRLGFQAPEHVRILRAELAGRPAASVTDHARAASDLDSKPVVGIETDTHPDLLLAP